MAAALLAARGAAANPVFRSRPVVAAAATASLFAWFLLLRSSLAEAVSRLPGAKPLPLAAAAVALLVPLAASAFAWRAALRAAGAEIGRGEALGCYGLGSLANTLLPARLGEPLRAGLFARRLPERDRGRLTAGAWALVGASRAAVSAALLAGAAAAGLVPRWTPAAPAVAAIALGGGRLALDRPRPRGVAPVLGWLCLSAQARLAALVCVLSALGIDHPLGPAFLSLAALGVASSLPLAPGAAGMASAAMALSIRHNGVHAHDGAAAAIAFHALETLATCAFGAAGAFALRRAVERGRGPGALTRSIDAKAPTRGLRLL